jgi:hypothetical protein
LAVPDLAPLSRSFAVNKSQHGKPHPSDFLIPDLPQPRQLSRVTQTPMHHS